MQVKPSRLSGRNLSLSLAALTAIIPLFSGCGYFVVTDPSFYAGISAPVTTLRVTQQMQLKDNARTTGVPVIFFVNGIQGGNAGIRHNQQHRALHCARDCSRTEHRIHNEHDGEISQGSSRVGRDWRS